MVKTKNIIKPKKIKKGAHIRVIAPARSLSLLSKEIRQKAIDRLEKFGFRLSFGKHTSEIDEFNSSSIFSRVEDLHEAFSDNTVDAILTVIGGYNSNQLLRYINYDIIAKNSKIICGFSDVTTLNNAITAKTGMITYIGPHFSSWAMRYGFEYSQEYFKKCCMEDNPFDLFPAKAWSDDPWYIDQEKRNFIPNDGYWVLQQGHGFGCIIGGHTRCLNALQGTEYWPGLDGAILILEDDTEINPLIFDRQLQSLIYQPDFGGVRGILIGRFQKNSKMTRELLLKIVKTKKELNGIPIIANVDFGHSTPIVTLPVGGNIEISATQQSVQLRVVEH